MADQYHPYSGAAAYGGNAWHPTARTSSTDPIISRLRPRDIAGILDQSFRIYRKHFLTYLAILAVVHVPLQTLIQVVNILFIGTGTSFASTYDPYSTPDYSGATGLLATEMALLGVEMALLVLYYVFIAISQAALVSGVADGYLDRPVSFGGAYRRVWKQKWQVLGLMLLQILIYLAAFAPMILIVSLVMGAAIAGSDSSALMGGAVCLMFPLMLLGFGVLLVVVIRLQAAVPALIVENLGPRQAIRRSWNLLQDYWWRTFGLMVLLYILNLIVASGPAALVTGLAMMLLPSNLVMSQAISGGITVLMSAIFMPLQYIAITLYYFDTRVRKEGFDIEAAVLQAYPNAYPQQPGQYAGAWPPASQGPQEPLEPYAAGGPGGYYGQQFTPPTFTPPPHFAQQGGVEPPALGYEQGEQPYAYPQYPQHTPGSPSPEAGHKPEPRGYGEQQAAPPAGYPENPTGWQPEGEPEAGETETNQPPAERRD